MEKQRIKRTIKSGKRLLITAVLLFASNLYGQSMSATQDTQELVPVEDQKLYPKQDIKYELYIPKAKSNNVQLQPQTLSSGIELRTVRKSDYYFGEGGTLIELWYRFDKKGTYKIPRLSTMVNGRRRFYYFAPLTVEEDPANMLPRIVIQFANGKTIYSDDLPSTTPLFNQKIGEKIEFKINLQYSTQLVQFNWEIPQDSIFSQTKVYEFTEIKYREKKYSNELIPIADFEWTSLTKGIIDIPKIHLSATAYKGYRTELTMPSFVINFIEASVSYEQSAENEILFTDAFNEEYNIADLSSKKQLTYEDCVNLAELRSKERNSPFTSRIYRTQRQEIERDLGLPSDQDEFNLVFLYFFSILTIILLLFLFIFLQKKKSIGVIVIAVFLTCTIAMCAYSGARASKKHAISTGCILTSIPEEKSNSTSEISAGNRVSILESTDNWYFVELGTISGWCKKDQIILIK